METKTGMAIDPSKFIRRKLGPNAGTAGGVKKAKPIVRKRFTEEQKMQAAATYAMLGNMAETSRVTGIQLRTLVVWKASPWFKEMLDQLRRDDLEQCGAKLQRIIHRAIAVVEDRVEHGNYVLDQKTGLIQRIPINIKDALKTTTEMMDRHEKIFNGAKGKELEEAIDARLARLAEEFSRFSKTRETKTTKEVKEEPLVIEQSMVKIGDACPS